MQPYLPCYERPACLVRQQIITFIEKRDRCSNKEFSWWPVFETVEEEWQEYTCTRCIDHNNNIEKIKWFVSLHTMRIPPEVFDYMYPENYKQLVILNKCQMSQRVENLRHLQLGAPHTQNAIYDLHRQLEVQIYSGLQCNGKAYRTTCWDSHTDLLEFLSSFLM